MSWTVFLEWNRIAGGTYTGDPLYNARRGMINREHWHCVMIYKPKFILTGNEQPSIIVTVDGEIVGSTFGQSSHNGTIMCRYA